MDGTSTGNARFAEYAQTQYPVGSFSDRRVPAHRLVSAILTVRWPRSSRAGRD
jgi:hypothetical protein